MLETDAKKIDWLKIFLLLKNTQFFTNPMKFFKITSSWVGKITWISAWLDKIGGFFTSGEILTNLIFFASVSTLIRSRLNDLKDLTYVESQGVPIIRTWCIIDQSTSPADKRSIVDDFIIAWRRYTWQARKRLGHTIMRLVILVNFCH